MRSNKVNQQTNNRMSVIIQRLLMIMAAIMMALVTFTACTKDDNGGDEGGNNGGGNNGGGNNGGSVKRMKSVVTTVPGAPETRADYTYNSEGTITRTDQYFTETGQLNGYWTFTNNTDGTVAKMEGYIPAIPEYYAVTTYSYDGNKKPSKRQIDIIYSQSLGVVSYSTTDYTFQNGREIREITKSNTQSGPIVANSEQQIDISYDSQGKRTTTITTLNGVKTERTERTYNADGTINKVTHYSIETNKIVATFTYSWENGKSTYDMDLYQPY